MSGESSSAAGWSSRLEPTFVVEDRVRRPDDPRLGEVVDFWRSDAAALRPGRGVLVGFPQDEGVRRNGGQVGAAEAPDAIRAWLYRLTPWDYANEVNLQDDPPLDLGNLRVTGSLEESQQALAEVIAAILVTGAIPVVLGGGHETAFGHYLGYVLAPKRRHRLAIINIDAHLDVRPCLDGQGHSGSPFRQALEHPTRPLAAGHYVCLGAQPHSVSLEHWRYACRRGCVVGWADNLRRSLVRRFMRERDRLGLEGCRIYLSIDADAVAMSEVPGVSAPNPSGLPGERVIACAQVAGASPEVASMDVVEINPQLDHDGQSARWAALVVWNFLVGLALRRPRNSFKS
jgi:formiminoglutamase